MALQDHKRKSKQQFQRKNIVWPLVWQFFFSYAVWDSVGSLFSLGCLDAAAVLGGEYRARIETPKTGDWAYLRRYLESASSLRPSWRFCLTKAQTSGGIETGKARVLFPLYSFRGFSARLHFGPMLNDPPQQKLPDTHVSLCTLGEGWVRTAYVNSEVNDEISLKYCHRLKHPSAENV